jgi:predicted PurR-regulated permease PerM
MRGELALWAIRGMALAFGALLVYGMALLAGAALRVLVIVFVAILFASALEPFIGWIRRRIRLGRAATILLVYVGFFVSVVAFALLIIPAAANQLNDVAAQLPAFIEQARAWAETLRPPALATSVGALLRAADRVISPPPPDPEDVVEVGITVAEAAISLVAVLAIVFFWLLEHARLQRYALAFLPAERRAGARATWNAIETRLGLWVRGQLILMASIGVATGVAYTLLGVPSALLLALIAGLSEAIPIVGPLIGAIPAILVAATVSPELAIVVAGVYVLLQAIEGNVLVPIVMRNAIGLSPFLVIVSLLAGAAVGGILGALLAVPVVALVEVILERLQARAVPVVQDAAAIDTATLAEEQRSLPDAPGRARLK